MAQQFYAPSLGQPFAQPWQGPSAVGLGLGPRPSHPSPTQFAQLWREHLSQYSDRPDHFPECEPCLEHRQKRIDEAARTRHIEARFTAQEVGAPQLPFGYDSTGLRTYRAFKVPNAQDAVAILEPHMNSPVPTTQTPSPKPQKRSRQVREQQELESEQAERAARAAPHLRPLTPPREGLARTYQPTPKRLRQRRLNLPVVAEGNPTQLHLPSQVQPHPAPAFAAERLPPYPGLPPQLHPNQAPVVVPVVVPASPSPFEDRYDSDDRRPRPPLFFGLEPMLEAPPPDARPQPESWFTRGMQFVSSKWHDTAIFLKDAVRSVGNHVSRIGNRNYAPANNTGEVVPQAVGAERAPKRRRTSHGEENGVRSSQSSTAHSIPVGDPMDIDDPMDLDEPNNGAHHIAADTRSSADHGSPTAVADRANVTGQDKASPNGGSPATERAAARAVLFHARSRGGRLSSFKHGPGTAERRRLERAAAEEAAAAKTSATQTADVEPATAEPAATESAATKPVTAEETLSETAAAAETTATAEVTASNEVTTAQDIPATKDDGRPEAAPESPRPSWLPRPKPRYQNISQFFENEAAHSIPGLEDLGLVPSLEKVRELAEQKHAREIEIIRRAEESALARANAHLATLGLRKPKAKLITPIGDEWEQRVEASMRRANAKCLAPDNLELSQRDFQQVVPEGIWLNDSIIQSSLTNLAHYVNTTAGVVLKRDTPKHVALGTFFWETILRAGPNGRERMLKRTWGLTPENFLDVDTITVPVNQSRHWTFLLIRPKRREVAYVDSFYSSGQREIGKIIDFVKAFAGPRYVADEWRTVTFDIPRQTNGYDCGMFVITNSIYLALGLDPSEYEQADMPLQRRRIAAMLLNGGFTGDFDLSPL